jgi:succinyl-diaminopimelate desuccinylase
LEHGIEGEILENDGYKSYVAVIGEGEKTLVLNGHLDVVSGKAGQFEPVELDGKIFGRGSADMKAGCAAMIHAIIALKDKPLTSRVMIQLVPDEETGGRWGTRFLVKNGYVGDFVICTEPTNLKISIQSKGIIRMDVESSGVAAHGSRPWEGENAIIKSIENYSKIVDLPIMKIGSEFYEGSTANLAKISGGDIYNRVPDSSVIGLDIRYVPHVDPEQIVADIRKVVDGDVTVKGIEHGVHVAADHPYVLDLIESLKRISGDEEIELTAQHGGSDARYFASLGIPAIEFGPSGDFWHGDGEYVEMDSMERLKDILIDFALNF